MNPPPLHVARIALLAAGFLAFAILLIPTVGTAPSAANEPAVAVAAVPADSDPVIQTDRSVSVAPDWSRQETVLGPGGTLTGAFDTLGVPGSVGTALQAAAGNHIDLRRLSPRTGVVALRESDDNLYAVAIRPSPERFVRISVVMGDRVGPGRVIELPVHTEVATTGGVVRTSVAQALSDSEAGRLLTARFADVFQWDVDLFVDPRPGDEVRVIYELQRVAALPPELPPYGTRVESEGDLLGVGRILAATYDGRMAKADAFWVEEPGFPGSYFDADGRPLRKSFLKSPLNYRRISSGFSRARRHPVTRKLVPHHGVDYAASPGTPVVATADGKVIASGWAGALGRAVRIRHGSEYVTVYGHLKGVAKGIRVGSEVRQNEVIGYVGSTGRATGPHLHYTMLSQGRPIDPLRFENPPAQDLVPALWPRLELVKSQWTPTLAAVPLRNGPVAIASASTRSGGA